MRTQTLLALSLAAAPTAGQTEAWPQFRGAQAAGVNDRHPLPAQWDVAKGTGVAWRTPMPGLSHASPVVWGDRVFVATAVAAGAPAALKVGLYGAGDSADDMVEHTFQLWCLDRDSGRPLWLRTSARGVPRFARHTKATHVDSTPATDGRHVVAVFGSQGMYCYTVDGELRWRVDLGELDVGPHNAMDLHWGYASSPVIAGGRVIVQADVKKEPFLGAFDLATGQPVWRVARDDTTSWATPTVAGDQVLVNGCKHMGAYRFADGAEVWRMGGGGGLPVPAPVLAGDLVLFTNNHRPLDASHTTKPVFAVRRDARGAIPVARPDDHDPRVAWVKARVGLYLPTPLVYRGLLYLCQAQGVVTVLDAKTGAQHGERHRLGDGGVGFSASAVAGDGKVYFTDEEGGVYVAKAGPDLEILATSKLGEICMTTPAISGGMLIFRTRHHVVAVGAPAK